MAPAGKSHLVMEYFCFKGDAVWKMDDTELTDLTVEHLIRLGFIKKQEVIDSMIVRVPNAYPLFEVGYQKYADDLQDYLGRFRNLHSAGRSGMFRYYNMDVAILSGIETAENIIQKSLSAETLERDTVVLAAR